MEMLVRQIFDMVLNLSNRFDSVIQSAKKSESKDSVIAMKDARIDELTRENVALKKQLEESQKNLMKSLESYNDLVDAHNSIVAQLREMKADGMKITK